ncbi:Carbohydrate deacetylase [Mytilus coruscus]|uniref:Carbohydrate deacetylase n=1 Tax=Mytilus coruscus TaxID=42192 RepID=A0A6J8AV87_MYTCO|nr:Carbohydrate deacetylase [Mytilus coruscus]
MELGDTSAYRLCTSTDYKSVNADDFGYGIERNDGIINCFKAGAISSTTMLVNGVAAEDAAKKAKLAGLPTGLHLNISEGKPVGPSAKTLTDSDGNLYELFKIRERVAEGRFNLNEVRDELQKQIDRFEELMGCKPQHVDGHQHVHVLPGICDIFAHVLSQNGIRSTRCPYEDLNPDTKYAWFEGDTKKMATLMAEVVQQSEQAKLIFRRNGLWLPSKFCGLQTMGIDMTKESLKNTLKQTFRSDNKDDIVSCELMVHPGYRTKEEGGCGTGPDEFSQSDQRELEMDILCDSDMLDFYREMEIELVSFPKCVQFANF